MTPTQPAQTARPRWPAQPFDPIRAYLDYDGYADEMVLYFDGAPSPAVNDAIDTPSDSDTALLVGLGPDGKDTGEVVGIHVYPLLAGAARKPAYWGRLAEPEPPAELIARFVAEVRDMFERYWTPAPPVAEQLAGARRVRTEE